ncbi:MAG: hypothetical protein EP329_15770 [Deltaproteobacteria bacterium]|nr:MAG: hypothetical protein EP329_15770 [Deltaproteobacteria bacterium]
MKRLLRAFVSALALLLLAAPAIASAPRTVAVMPWAPGAAPKSLDGFGTALAGMVITDLAAVPELQLVERERLTALLDELALSKTSFVDPKAAVKLGHGLGAELMVSGSFSIVANRLLMDARLVAVQTGSILAAVRSEGPLEEYVAVEKDVVEQLLAQLKIALTPGARRKLLVRAQTEDPGAFAKYGAGLEARDAGDVASAKKAFEAALAADPEFADAATALTELAAKAEALSAQEAARGRSVRERSLDDALTRLVDETVRPDGFAHTRETVRDFAIRQVLLQQSHQHCRRYAEAKAFLEHTRGHWPALVATVAADGDHRAAWEEASTWVDARAEELGVRGPETWFGKRPGEVMHAIGARMFSAKSLLLASNLAPEKFRDSLAGALAACFPREARPGEWAGWVKRVADWGLGSEALWSQYGEGPATVSVADGMTLHQAFLEADAAGVGAEVTARVEAILARHPEGDKNRRDVLSRIREITDVAASRERRLAHRLGRDEAAVVRDAEALRGSQGTALQLDDPLCAELVALETPGVDRAWTRWLEHRDSTNARFRDDRLDQLADAVAVVRLAGCFADQPKRPGLDALYAEVRRGLERRHPGQLEDEKCRTEVAKISETARAQDAVAMARLAPKDAARRVSTVLSRLHGLRTRRCLVP